MERIADFEYLTGRTTPGEQPTKADDCPSASLCKVITRLTHRTATRTINSAAQKAAQLAVSVLWCMRASAAPCCPGRSQPCPTALAHVHWLRGLTQRF